MSRFGLFELNHATGELRKNGHLIKLPPQPCRVLVLLAGNAGHLVTREQLQQEIWGRETFVDFEKGLNFCVNQIRAALGDDPEKPHYIETLPKRGYRFIAPVEVCAHAAPLAHMTPVPAPGAGAGVLPRPRRRLWLIGGAAAVLAGVAALALWHPWRPRLAFQQRDWVLVAGFENRTGEPIFDGTLEYALEEELSNSQFVNVVPRERIADTLSLMKKPAGTRIDASVGREICLRDGGIRALLVGRVEKVDTTYLLSATLVDPASGRTVAGLSEQAAGQHEVVAAIRRLSSRVRKRLGEELPLIQQGERQLEKVTTPSLRALQLYTQGMALVNESQWPEAAELLEQAIREDPDFASAHILLAHCYSNIKKDKEAAPHYQRAFELADTVPDRERYFITGSYYERFQGDRFLPDRKKATLGWEKAAQEYEILLRSYPDHYWATNNLRGLYSQLGRRAEAIPYILRLADLRPHDFRANLDAALALAVANRNPAEAEPYLQRARALTSSVGQDTWRATWLQLFPAYQYWLQGDLRQVQRELTHAEQGLGSRTGASRDGLIGLIAWFYLTLGKTNAAEELFQRYRDPSMRDLGLAWVAFARGDKAALSEHLLRIDTEDYVSMTALMLMIREGLLANAENSILWAEKNPPYAPNQLIAVRGELALARGNRAEGISLLQEGMQGMAAFGIIGFSPPFFLGSESLAQVYQQQGDFEKAVQVLEAASTEKSATYPYWGPQPVGLFWMRTQVRLAQLYRKVGREEDARKIEDQLLKLLANADPDYPILLQLKRSVTLRSAQPMK